MSLCSSSDAFSSCYSNFLSHSDSAWVFTQFILTIYLNSSKPGFISMYSFTYSLLVELSSDSYSLICSTNMRIFYWSSKSFSSKFWNVWFIFSMNSSFWFWKHWYLSINFNTYYLHSSVNSSSQSLPNERVFLLLFNNSK